MLFSVVIPTYKLDASMLERAIRSVESQEETDWEIIVVDDNPCGSGWKLQTQKLQQKYQGRRISFLYHSDNRGANAARNTAVKAARGEIIAFLDADDEWQAEYLRLVRECFERYDVGITAAGVRRIFSDRIADAVMTHADGSVYHDLIYGDIVGPTSCVAVRKTALLEAGLFDESIPARMDYDMWLRVCKNCEIRYIRKPIVHIHCDGHERISTGSMKHINGTQMVMEKLASDPQLAPYARKIRFRHTLYLGVRCLQEERYAMARSYFRKAFRYGVTPGLLAYGLVSLCPPVFRALRKTYRRAKANAGRAAEEAAQ